ncbi:hypothetical protein [Micromonospora wenchangensis]
MKLIVLPLRATASFRLLGLTVYELKLSATVTENWAVPAAAIEQCA